MIIRTSSTTAGGSANSISLGGRPSDAAPSTSNNGFFDTITAAQNDSGYTDHRCLFIYNNTSDVFNNVKVQVANYGYTGGSGATVTVGLSSVATNAHASYVTGVIANKTTAPSISGSYASSATIGTLNPGQVKAVWLRRVLPAKVAGGADRCAVNLSGERVIED